MPQYASINCIFTSNNDLKGLESILNGLKNLYIKATSLSLFVKESPDGATENQSHHKSKLGIISDLENLMKALTYKDSQVFLEFDSNHFFLKHL